MYPEELARLYYIHSGPPDKWGLGQTQCHSSVSSRPQEMMICFSPLLKAVGESVKENT